MKTNENKWKSMKINENHGDGNADDDDRDDSDEKDDDEWWRLCSIACWQKGSKF